MSDVRVKLKIGGVRQLLKGPEVTAEIARRVRRGAAAAGEGVEGVVKSHRYTARGFVQTSDDVGRERQADGQVLLRALDAMR